MLRSAHEVAKGGLKRRASMTMWSGGSSCERHRAGDRHILLWRVARSDAAGGVLLAGYCSSSILRLQQGGLC